MVIHAPLGAIACHGRLGMPLVFDGCQEGLGVGLLCLQVAEEARPTRSSSPLHVNGRGWLTLGLLSGIAARLSCLCTNN